jgi:hypothetical protein
MRALIDRRQLIFGIPLEGAGAIGGEIHIRVYRSIYVAFRDQ